MATVNAVEAGHEAGRPRSRKGARTRGRLLEAAKAVFEEDGFLEARISDIADRAGLSHGSFYHYFDSKEQIFREIVLSLEERIYAPLPTVIFAPGSTAPPRERIREGIRVFLEAYQQEARIIGVIEQVSRYDDHIKSLREEFSRSYDDPLIGSIKELQRRELADAALDPVLAVRALGAMSTRFAEMWFVERTVECTLDEGTEQLSLLWANALQLKDPSPRAPRS